MWQFERWVEYLKLEPSGWHSLNERLATGFTVESNSIRSIYNLFSDRENRLKAVDFDLFMGRSPKPKKRKPQTVDEFREMKAIMAASSTKIN
jgi:hypothetical protein